MLNRQLALDFHSILARLLQCRQGRLSDQKMWPLAEYLYNGLIVYGCQSVAQLGHEHLAHMISYSLMEEVQINHPSVFA